MDKKYPLYATSNYDKYVMEVFYPAELKQWQETMEKFHAIDRKKAGGISKRLKMRPILEKAWKELKKAFLSSMISCN